MFFVLTYPVFFSCLLDDKRGGGGGGRGGCRVCDSTAESSFERWLKILMADLRGARLHFPTVQEQ